MELTAKHCTHCDQIHSHDKYHCPLCFSEELEERQLSGKGEVYSYTKIYAAPKQFADQAPFFVILVHLEEGLKVTARYSGEKVQIGEKVELESIVNRAYHFQPAMSKTAF
ncbi:OB-fold domain-containing protein [Metabacillus dongyingensis]|uniref:Zn-ribbon domain-containing OB-fold protein n=1 Tax=Metabacillus dongyingensis TaxID=2874282 RepID=UPI003B8AD1D1